MAGPHLTFKPETVRKSHPWEQADKWAWEIVKHQQKAAKRFQKRFMREFVPAVIADWNRDAKRLGLPQASRRWFNISPAVKGGSTMLIDLYVKNRAKFMSRLFPGMPAAKANKAYDLLLKKMRARWKHVVKSGPSSGLLGHELGHAETGHRHPKYPIGETGALGKPKKKHNMAEVVNEAVASYHGYKRLWRLWGHHGIPKKAWGAWLGFPTYTSWMKPADVKSLLARLKKLEARFPGISSMTWKVLYRYNDYVRPIMYNIPGKDWTAAEKAALKRWLKARRGVYRERLPATPRQRLRHMRRQPYVRRAPTQAPDTAVASRWPPLSKRAMGVPLSVRTRSLVEVGLSPRSWPPPLSKRAGEVIPFPGQQPEKPEKPEDGGEGVEGERGKVLPLGRWFLLHFGSDPIRWYPAKDQAQRALEEVKEAFVQGGTEERGLINDIVMDDVMRDAMTQLERAGLLRSEEVLSPDDLFNLDITNNPTHAAYAEESYAFIEDPEYDDERAGIADAGLGIVEAPPKFAPPDKAVGEGLPPYPPAYDLDELPPEVIAKIWPRKRNVADAVRRAAAGLAERVQRKLEEFR